MTYFSENLTNWRTGLESRSKNSSWRPCAFHVDLLIDALDHMTLDQCRRWPGSSTNIMILQRSDYLQLDPHMDNVYSSFHLSILAYICHNSAKTLAKATVLPNECRILKVAQLPHHQRYPRFSQSASVIRVTSQATSGLLGSDRESPPVQSNSFSTHPFSAWESAYLWYKPEGLR